jgi:AcrR family transcriptional regulator
MIREPEVTGKTGVEETRLRIFAATRTLYASRGSRGTTTREVADLAGVNEATLFRHFGTKQQLLAAMLDYYTGATNFPEVLERARGLATIEEQLRELAFAAVDALRKKEDLIKISMAEEIANPEGSTCAWRAPTEARRRLTEFFEGKVASKELRGDAHWLARTFMSLFFALVLARGIWGEEASAPSVAIESMVDLFLNGARVS